jgi:hypothetical protein
VDMEKHTFCIDFISPDEFDVSWADDSGELISERGVDANRIEFLVLTAAAEKDPDTQPPEIGISEDSTSASVAPTQQPMSNQSPNQSGSVQENIRTSRARMLCHDQMFQKLEDVLPLADDDDIWVDDFGATNIISDNGLLKIWVNPKGGGFYDVDVMIGQKIQPRKVQISFGNAVQYIFDLFASVDTMEDYASAEKYVTRQVLDTDNTNLEVEPSEAYEILRELASELGKPTDLFRNKDLFDLNKLSTAAPKPIAGPYSLLDELENAFGSGSVSGSATENVFYPKESEPPLSSSLKGSQIHAGHPVSLNECRDISRPYQRTLGNKVLVDLGFPHGVQLVDKADVPAKKYLSWNPKTGGIELVEGQENVIRPSWKFRR